MKKRMSKMLAACLVVNAVGTAVPVVAYGSESQKGIETQVFKSVDNLIKNSGFEETVKDSNWQGGVGPMGWSLWFPKDAPKPTLSLDTQNVLSGSHSVRISSTDKGSRVDLTQIIPATEGSRYTIEIPVKLEGVGGNAPADGMMFRLLYLDDKNQELKPNGKEYLTPSNKKLKGTADWKTYKYTIQTPPGTKGIKVELFFDKTAGTVWLDDIVMEESYQFTIQTPKVDLLVGQSTQLEGRFEPAQNPEPEITWTSSDEQIATVDASGLVTAKALGVATITATTKAGDQAEAVVEVDTPANETIYAEGRDQYRESLVGNNMAGSQDADYLASLKTLDEKVTNMWGEMNQYDSSKPTDDRQKLWDKYDVKTNSAQIVYTYNNFKTMARAYQSIDSQYYKNEALKVEIIKGIEWMYKHVYNEKVGTKPYGNWYHWNISGAQGLVDTLIIMHDEIPEATRNDQVRALRFFTPSPWVAVNGPTMTGANLLEKALITACIGLVDGSYKSMIDARDASLEILPYVTKGDGFYEDGSFIQHTAVPYAGNYGMTLVISMEKVLSILQATPWCMPEEELDVVFDWVMEAFEPLYFRGAIMDMVSGRTISHPNTSDHTRGKRLMISALRLAEIASPDVKMQIKQFVKENIAKDKVCEGYFNGMAPSEIYELKTLLKETQTPVRGDLDLHKVYGSMDRVVHHKPGYALGISMYSSRIGRFTYGNGENKKGWHMSEGMTYLYNDDETQFSDGYWPTVDMMRLPGITTDHSKGKVEAWYLYYSSQDWVGGSSLDKQYGATGMAFETEETSLTGKKSWFSFDDEVVALGTEIQAADNRLVETIVENRKISGDNTFTVNGQEMPKDLGWESQLQEVEWAHLSGNTVAGTDGIGYYFPQKMNLTAKREERTGSMYDINDKGSKDPITRNYLSMAVEHGNNPVDEGYNYVLLPNKTAEEVEAYAKESSVRILANNSDVQAVAEEELGVAGFNFWNPSVVEEVEAHTPVSMMIKEEEGRIKVGLSDPTQKQASVRVTLPLQGYRLVTSDPAVSVNYTETTAEITVNTKGAAGKTFEMTFEEVKAEKPMSSLESGTYTTSQSITLRTNTPGASIYYTTDSAIGVKLTPEQGDLYNGETIQVVEDMTLWAIAVADGMKTSETARYDYIIEPIVVDPDKVARPLASLPSGKYEGEQQVTLSVATEGADIYYTLGEEAIEITTDSAIRYNGEALPLREDCVLQAIAYKDGYAPSSKVTYVYEIEEEQVKPPVRPDEDDDEAEESLTLEEMIEDLIEKLEDLDEERFEAFLEAILENLPYSVSGREEIQIVSPHIPKEVLKLLNEQPEILKKLGINLMDYIHIEERTSVDAREFKDLKETHWAYGAIAQMAKEGIIEGYQDHTFRPNQKVSVAETMTFMNRLLLDVKAINVKQGRKDIEQYVTNREHWSYFAMASMATKLEEETIQAVYTQKKALTRAELALILEDLTKGLLPETRQIVVFADTEGTIYEEALAYCVRAGLLQGVTQEKIEPERAVTRAELMIVLERLSEKLIK